MLKFFNGFQLYYEWQIYMSTCPTKAYGIWGLTVSQISPIHIHSLFNILVFHQSISQKHCQFPTQSLHMWLSLWLECFSSHITHLIDMYHSYFSLNITSSERLSLTIQSKFCYPLLFSSWIPCFFFLQSCNYTL